MKSKNSDGKREIAEKEKIEIIERSGIHSDDKLSLMLLLLNRKDASFLGNAEIIREKKDESQIIEKFRKELEETKRVLDEIGFFYRASEIKVKDDIASFSIEIAKDENNLSELIKASEKGEDKKIGTLLGFPMTAVESYNTDEALDLEMFLNYGLSEEEREQLKQSGVLNFVGFQPSRENWQAELAEAKKDQEVIKEKAKNLYDEIVGA